MPNITPEQLAAAYNRADEAVAKVWEIMKELNKAYAECEEARKAKQAVKAQFDNQMGLKE